MSSCANQYEARRKKWLKKKLKTESEVFIDEHGQYITHKIANTQRNVKEYLPNFVEVHDFMVK